MARMEDLLDTYCLPPDPQVPLIGMDEQPVQLIKDDPLAPAGPSRSPTTDGLRIRAATAPRPGSCSPNRSKAAAVPILRERRTAVD
ncbi:MAG: hypothetical protein U1F42_02555 [Candidatus Competibacteraceae bacterium]